MFTWMWTQLISLELAFKCAYAEILVPMMLSIYSILFTMSKSFLLLETHTITLYGLTRINTGPYFYQEVVGIPDRHLLDTTLHAIVWLWTFLPCWLCHCAYQPMCTVKNATCTREMEKADDGSNEDHQLYPLPNSTHTPTPMPGYCIGGAVLSKGLGKWSVKSIVFWKN